MLLFETHPSGMRRNSDKPSIYHMNLARIDTENATLLEVL